MSKAEHPADNAPASRDRPRAGLGLHFIIMVGLIAFVAGSIVTLAVTTPFRESPPPAEPAVAAAPPIQPAQPTPQPVTATPVTEFDRQRLQLPETPLAESIPATSNPSIPDPTPWQYDPINNKHYDPDHGHWHAGKAPSVIEAEPWQYDPDTDKYWDPRPGHDHWHPGKPPPPEQRETP